MRKTQTDRREADRHTNRQTGRDRKNLCPAGRTNTDPTVLSGRSSPRRSEVVEIEEQTRAR